MPERKLRRFVPTKISLLAGAAALALLATGPGLNGALVDRANAQERVSINTEFREALDPYGEWRRHPRWGEVWIPTRVEAGWRPYQVGHWSYTNEWGWFWISDDDWGWVTDHYGRWIDDPQIGWIWVPGREWSPAWVRWRHGHGHIGWAPLPPDDVAFDIEEHDEPAAWVFVRETDFLAPRIDRVFVRETEVREVFRETEVVNRTVLVEDRGFAVNPGIEPSFVAAAIGHPIRPVEVRPPVIAGTARLPNAVEIRPGEHLNRELTRPQVREASTEIRPASHVPPPTPLRPGEKGRLGENPPAAARGETRAGPREARPGTGRMETPSTGAKQAPGRVQQGNIPQRTQPGRLGTEQPGQRGQQGALERPKQPPGANRPGQRGAVPNRGEARTPGATQEQGRAQPNVPQRERAGAMPQGNRAAERARQQEGLRGPQERGRAQQATPERLQQQQRGAARQERAQPPRAERGQLGARGTMPEQRRAPERSAGAAERGGARPAPRAEVPRARPEPAPRAQVPGGHSVTQTGRPGGGEARPRNQPPAAAPRRGEGPGRPPR